MPFLNDTAFDSGLSWITANGDRIDICSAEPTTYAQATSTLTLGNAAVTIGSPTDGASSGRRVIVPAISGGSVTATGTASHIAITDGTGTLIATQALASSQAVTNGNLFNLTSFSITYPDPT